MHVATCKICRSPGIVWQDICIKRFYQCKYCCSHITLITMLVSTYNLIIVSVVKINSCSYSYKWPYLNVLNLQSFLNIKDNARQKVALLAMYSFHYFLWHCLVFLHYAPNSIALFSKLFPRLLSKQSITSWNHAFA